MYNPHNWVSEEIITAEKLNNIETGVQNTEKEIETIRTIAKGEKGDTGTVDNAGLISAPAFQSLQNQVTEQLAQIAIDVKTYGAIGDGIADDTFAVKSAFSFAVANNRSVNFPEGTYNIISNESWDCPQIISDGAVINITGTLRFLFVGNIRVKNLKVLTTDGGGYGADRTSSLGYLFRPKNTSDIIEFAEIENVKIEGIVTSGKRITGGLRINQCTEWLSVTNVVGKNCGGVIALLGTSKNITVKDISGLNVETLVQAQGVDVSYFDNLSILNTSDQYAWWIGKNVGVGVNGKDCLLIESGQNVKITNVEGEYAHERPIYCQASNVFADNLESINTGCMKFVGMADGTEQIKNVYVGSVVIRDSVANDRDGYGQIYGCDDIYYDDIKIFATPNANRNYFFIGASNGKITFNNIEVYGTNRALFSKSAGITDQVTINNMRYETDLAVTVDAMIMVKDTYTTTLDIINKLTINRFTSKNGPSFISRSLIYNDDNNPIATKIVLNNVDANGTGTGAFSLYGLLSLAKAELSDIKINNKIALKGYSGTSMYLIRNLSSAYPVRNLKIIKDNEVGTRVEILINKDDSTVADILNYIQTLSFSNKATSDYSFELPIKTTHNWKIKVQSLNGGYAEYRLIGGVLTEVYNTATSIVIGSFGVIPTVGKLSLYVNTDTSFLTLRNRISSDDFKITVEKLSL